MSTPWEHRVDSPLVASQVAGVPSFWPNLSADRSANVFPLPVLASVVV